MLGAGPALGVDGLDSATGVIDGTGGTSAGGVLQPAPTLAIPRVDKVITNWGLSVRSIVGERYTLD